MCLAFVLIVWCNKPLKLRSTIYHPYEQFELNRKLVEVIFFWVLISSCCFKLTRLSWRNFNLIFFWHGAWKLLMKDRCTGVEGQEVGMKASVVLWYVWESHEESDILFPYLMMFWTVCVCLMFVWSVKLPFVISTEYVMDLD